ncbi:unnamed protein product, partial [Meganyctiphanes norvegica]
MIISEFHNYIFLSKFPFYATLPSESLTTINKLLSICYGKKAILFSINHTNSFPAKKLKDKLYLAAYEQVAAEQVVTEEGIVERLAGNPLHAFHLIKRMTVDWKHIEANVNNDTWKYVTKALAGMEHLPPRIPKEDDLHGAAQALVRLHDVYNLNMSQLVQGNIGGVKSFAELSAQDCLYMGKHSFNLGMYHRAVEWFEEAYVLSGKEKNATVSQGQVSTFLNTALRAHEEVTAASGGDGTTNVASDPSSRTSTEWEDSDNFQALCRGENLRSEAYISTLTCYYDHRGEAYFYLMPAKIERLHHDPEILKFHHMLTDAEIHQIKETAKPLLARSMVQGMKGKGNTVSNTRTSKVAWLDDYVIPLFQRISKRVSLLTGLSLDIQQDHAEYLQVSNYGVGGHYNPHHDYLLVDKTEYELKHNINPRELRMGDRIATFMFYLNDVSLGGATAFPRLGAAAWPSKGSAVFWHNLKKSGAGDTRTLHGACPVLHGTKWVSNKWIREKGQFLRHACVPSPHE